MTSASKPILPTWVWHTVTEVVFINIYCHPLAERGAAAYHMKIDEQRKVSYQSHDLLRRQ